MKLSRHLNYLFWIFFLLKACKADDTVLTTITADIKELRETIKDIRLLQLEDRLIAEQRYTDLKQMLHEAIATQSYLQQVHKDDKNPNMPSTMDYNKETTSIQQQIEQSLIGNRAQLSSLQTAIQTIVPIVQTLESAVKNIEQNLQTSHCNLPAQGQHPEFQSLRNTIEGFNRTLDTIADYLGPSFANCTAALKRTASSGVYRLRMTDTDIAPYKAYCLLDPDGGTDWTVIQRRRDGSVSFYRNWNEYKFGFGDPGGEYWLGLEKIYAMTSKQKYELWFELVDHEGIRRYAKYADFKIGNEEEKYYLKSVGAFTGNAGDSLRFPGKNRKFSTFDQDNDGNPMENCVQIYLDAWWSVCCGCSSPNGEYNNTNYGKGVNWYQWHGSQYSLKYVHMAIRPSDA